MLSQHVSFQLPVKGYHFLIVMEKVSKTFEEFFENVYGIYGKMLGASKSILEGRMQVIMKNSLRNAHQHPLQELSAMKNYYRPK